MSLLETIVNNDIHAFRKLLTIDTELNDHYELIYAILTYTNEPEEYFAHWDRVSPIDINAYLNSIDINGNLILTRMVSNNVAKDKIHTAIYLGCDPFYSTYGDMAPIFHIYNAGYAMSALKSVPEQLTITQDLSNCKIPQTGQTLLHYAGSKGDVEFVRVLLDTYDMDKDLEYMNTDTMRSETVVDCLLKANVENVLQILFADLKFDINRLYTANTNMTYFSRVCELGYDITWLMENANVDLVKPTWPACIVAAKANQVETVVQLVVDYDDDIFSMDSSHHCALYYILKNFHPLYYKILDIIEAEDANGFFVDAQTSYLAIHCIAEHCNVDVMKYVLENKGWGKPNNLLTVAVNMLLKEDESKYAQAIDTMIYLVNKMKYKPKPKNKPLTQTPLYIIVAVFLHFVHRVVPAYAPLPDITYDGSDESVMVDFFQKHDKLPDGESASRIRSALHMAYTVLPESYQMRPFVVRQQLSTQEYSDYIYKQSLTTKRKLAHLVDVCLLYCDGTELQQYFHPASKFYTLFNRMPTLSRLAKHNI